MTEYENREIPSIKRRAWAEIDLDNAIYNFREVRKATKSKVCCVIKANAYGHGAVELARLYQTLGADYLAVSNIEEALQLRQNSITLPILILGYTSCDCAKILADNDLIQSVFSYDYGMSLAQNAAEFGVTVKVHIKIDTGMGRIGFLFRDGSEVEIGQAVEVCKSESLDAEGVFMHFAVSDEGDNGDPYTREQFGYFMKALEMFKAYGIDFKIKHCANSAAIFDYPEFHLDMVRAGLVLYGLKPSVKVKNIGKLKPVMSLHSVVAQIKTVTAGQTVSYGRVFEADREIRVATIPIGYADGFRRKNGQVGYSLSINGRPSRIIGRICMDQLMSDVSDIDCRVGDEVVVFGRESATGVDEIAVSNGTVNYEIICGVGERVPRAFVKDGRIVGWKDDILGE